MEKGTQNKVHSIPHLYFKRSGKTLWHTNTIIKSHQCSCYQTVHIIHLQSMWDCMHLCWISLFNISQGLYLIFAVYWAFRRIFRFKQSYSTLKFFIIQLSWLQCITNHKRRVLHPHFIISVHCNIQVMDLTENMGFKNNITSNRHDENQIFQLQMWCTLTL